MVKFRSVSPSSELIRPSYDVIESAMMTRLGHLASRMKLIVLCVVDAGYKLRPVFSHEIELI